MKVDLLVKPVGWMPEYYREVPIRKSLPFYLSGPGKYVHRIRSATNYFSCYLGDGLRYRHTGLSLWCGGTGFVGSDKRATNRILATIPEGELVCATCEGRAIGAGQLGSPIINGNMVKFAPRI